MKIEIPKSRRDGRCNVSCPFLNVDAMERSSCPYECEDSTAFQDARPGPSCPGPGVYELVPEGEVSRVPDPRVGESLLEDTLREIDRLRAEVSRKSAVLKALVEAADAVRLHHLLASPWYEQLVTALDAAKKA